MRSTVGESLVAVLIAGVLATISAIVGFVGAIFFCGTVFRGEMTEWALVLAPASALIFGVVLFVFVFRKISSYGDPTAGGQ
jgi:hypothetical protein